MLIEGIPLLWPFFIYNALVVIIVAGILLASYLIGPRSRGKARDIPYESGILPTGSARLRYGTHFYTVGIFFILFDVEAVFIYAWAVAFRELAWLGYIEVLLFIIVLFLGLVYVWKMGGLDWSPSRRRSTNTMHTDEEPVAVPAPESLPKEPLQ
jgi:NADH-quinone oxidoreductase subunit A